MALWLAPDLNHSGPDIESEHGERIDQSIEVVHQIDNFFLTVVKLML